MKVLGFPKVLVLHCKHLNCVHVKSGAEANKVVFKRLILLVLLILSNSLRAEPISLQLSLSAIDFGDVYTHSEVDYVLVDFIVKADNNRNYTVEISNDDSGNVLELSRTAGGGYKLGSITYTETGTGNNQIHEFYVAPETANIRRNLSAAITVQVVYTDSQ
jgi:hypothetical protein